MYIFYQLLNGESSRFFIAYDSGWCYSEAVYPSECEWLVPGTFDPNSTA